MGTQEVSEEVLYHYCSIDTLKKILENKTLRFSDVTKSNDADEIKLLWDKYYENMIRRATNKAAGGSLKFMIEQQFQSTAFLAFCLSRLKDDLLMWSCYGYQGVNIGFQRDKLLEWTTRICLHTDNNYPNAASIATLQAVEYYDIDQIDAYCNDICSGAKLIVDGYDKIFNRAPISKSDFFIGEQEERVLLTIFMNSLHMTNKIDYVNPKGRRLKTVNFECASNRYFDSVMVCHVPFDPSMIQSITLAPNCSLKKTDIQKLLFVCGIDGNIEIKKSRGSYR